MTYGEMGMTYGAIILPRFLRKFVMTEGLKLIILTYKWRKFIKPKEITFLFLFIHLYKILCLSF